MRNVAAQGGQALRIGFAGHDLRTVSGDLAELMPSYHAVIIGTHAVHPSRKHLPIKTLRLERLSP